VKACEVAIKTTGLGGEEVQLAMSLLQQGESIPDGLRTKIQAKATEMDEAYIRLWNNGDDVEKRADALRLFSLSRAASALAFILNVDSDNDHEAIYEAIMAFEDSTEIVKVIEKILSPSSSIVAVRLM
jgi:hypothetical protein